MINYMIVRDTITGKEISITLNDFFKGFTVADSDEDPPMKVMKGNRSIRKIIKTWMKERMREDAQSIKQTV